MHESQNLILRVRYTHGIGIASKPCSGSMGVGSVMVGWPSAGVGSWSCLRRWEGANVSTSCEPVVDKIEVMYFNTVSTSSWVL